MKQVAGILQTWLWRWHVPPKRRLNFNELHDFTYHEIGPFKSVDVFKSSQSHIATDGQSVSQSVSLGVEPHLGLMARYLLLFDSYGLVFVGRPLWRDDGSVFFICCWPLPAQSFSGLSPLGLPQIWDFPFHRLLRLAGSRWRYSTPPPHGLYWVRIWPGNQRLKFFRDFFVNNFINPRHSQICQGLMKTHQRILPPEEGMWKYTRP
jgi:hypothetical protein